MRSCMNRSPSQPPLRGGVPLNKLYTLNVLFLLFLLSACSLLKHSPDKPTLIVDVEENNLEINSIINNIHSHYPQFEWLSAKANTSVSFDDQSLSFNTHIRIRKDSAIWISATIPPGIEGARMLFTNDTVQLIDRLHSTYYKGSYQYLDTLFNTHLDYATLQALITTNFEGFTTAFGNYLLTDTSQYYGWLAAVPSSNSNNAVSMQWIIHFFKENAHVSDLSIDESLSNRKLLAQYKNIQESSGQFFPFQINFQIEAEKNADISLTFEKIEINKPLEFPFKIPVNYKPINH